MGFRSGGEGTEYHYFASCLSRNRRYSTSNQPKALCPRVYDFYGDGWSAYCPLNEMGCERFTVIQKYSFKTSYTKTDTGEVVVIHTNRMEGPGSLQKTTLRECPEWSFLKFEGHIAEITWRAHRKSDLYTDFFPLVS